ncbi:uncharacterized protein LOC123880684 isoform X1 [Maniola jurtina]|uniref:uncharacterized protein LOC123880684 isoform X1 n=1 Tax=Maniola jurtina TaxID=191418 RepID=UPI001E687430|nr:uncharacterized protein LOC123880684 isoform X1 [Maniola jurtina]
MSFRNYYDSPSSAYSKNRSTERTAATTERPSTVTAKYTTTPSYKSSSIPVLNDRSTREETPISAIASRYASYKQADKPISKYEKKDFSKLSVPSVTRSRDVSPVSTTSKYSLSRTARTSSPERRTAKSYKEKCQDISPIDRDKDIPNKTDKASSYSSLSNYKLYPRTSSYSRPTPRVDAKPEITVNRYAIANRLSSSSYLRSPTPIKRSTESPILHHDVNKPENDKPTIPHSIAEEKNEKENKTEIFGNGTECTIDENNEIETVTVVTRHTSPTPPGSSAYVRMRRADMAKTIEKVVTRTRKRPEMIDKEMQSDRLDDPTRSSRFGTTSRTSMTNWTYYSPNVNSYTGYAGRHLTQYSNLSNNTNCNDRSSRSRSKEPAPIENKGLSPNTENKENPFHYNNLEPNEDTSKILCAEKQEDDPSEIVINVNFKLKKAKSPPSTPTSNEITCSEKTISSNNQLPPQPPKSESVTKVRKVKIRKSSTDSSSDSTSSKKIVKKRSKSVSSTDSDQNNDKNGKPKDSSKIAGKNLSRNSSSTSLQNGPSKLKYSKSRESTSPESSITLSTQSSISEDETVPKTKFNNLPRLTINENSDQSSKQSPSIKNEGCEEAKSFLIRALAPVTNLFKQKHQDNDEINRTTVISHSDSAKDNTNFITENGSRSRNNTYNIIASNDDNVVKLKAIRHIESGDRTSWLDSDTDQKKASNDKDLQQESYNDRNNSNDLKRSLKPNCFADEEKPWWLDSNANIPEGIERLSPPKKSSSDSDKSEKFNFFKVRHIESGERNDWRVVNTESSSNVNKQESQNNLSLSKSGSDQRTFPIRRIRHIESGERPWWLSSDQNIPEGIEKLPTPPPQDSDSSDSEEIEVYIPPSQIPPFPLHLPDDEPLGARRSPEGLETPKDTEEFTRGRSSPYENNRQYRRESTNLPYQKGAEKYISRYTDIDDILGTSGQIYSPFMESILARRTGQLPFDDDECEEIDPTQVRIHDSTAQMPVIKKLRCRSEIIDCRDEDQLDDATLQVFKDGDYGPYLDLDSTLGEQDEELEGLQDSRKNALVLRTQLSVRVHAIIERLLHSQGRELRRALFTLKQILQSDKDLVHEFVANKGLDCLMQVANTAVHNYLDYILRALGQILLYVDGMHGVMNHKRCIQWMYSLISSRFRHVVKTALKLLLVFVEYTDKNCLLLIEAITVVDSANGRPFWFNVMKILQDVDASDTELLIYATTLINRCLNSLPDRDMYYDHVDSLQEQGIDDIVQLYMSKQGTDLDLLRQLQIFEAVLLYEDGDESGTALKQLDESIITSVRRRSLNLKGSERRKSKKQEDKEKAKTPVKTPSEPDKIAQPRPTHLPSILDSKENKELSTALKRRRDRYARQAHHIMQQQELMNASANHDKNGEWHTNPPRNYSNFNGTPNRYSTPNGNLNGSKYNVNDMNGHADSNGVKASNLPDILLNGNQRYTTGLKQRMQNGTLGHSVNAADALAAAGRQLDFAAEPKDDREILLHREHSIKDLAQRLTSSVSPSTEEKPLRVSDMAGIVSKAKEELAKSKSKEIIKSPAIEISPKIHDIKVSENDLHWEELRKGCLNREFHLCDLDFSDLKYDSDDDAVFPAINASNGPPPPPPGMLPPLGIPPPLPTCFLSLPKNLPSSSISSELSCESANSTLKKSKKTVKLFWKEIHENPLPTPVKAKVGGSIWDDLPEVNLDTASLEHLFESRTNDLIIKEKLMEPKRNLILDTKRSNAINIAMKKLPTPQTIKVAIMKMDATVIGREGIEKLLTMLPTQEEKVKIQEAQYANPDLPLGSAEQFLLTLASINELSSRLKLWVFKLDFDNLEKEIAEPLMDLKQGIELLKVNKTFKVILSTLRSVGSFLNGNQVKGFRLEYLSKVMEVKDTVQKHPLLYHICEMIIEKFPDTTDFFSEVGPVIRASKVDFDVLNVNLMKLETDCKASWDHMKRVAKHDGSQIFKTKINEFLTDAAERIILLTLIKKRVMSRYNKFLLYLGVPPIEAPKTKPAELLKVIAEFALEYRTTRERVLQQLEKRANHRERNKTRGKMIIDVGNYSTKSGEHTADSALKELLKSDADADLLADRRKPPPSLPNGEDEIIESLVRCATSKRRPLARDRRRNRLADRKSLNRTLDGHQSWPGTQTTDQSPQEVQQRL